MKKYSLIRYSILLAGIVLFTSCKKYLNEGPITSTYDAKFWTSETAVDQASQAMYLQLRDDMRADASHFIFGDLASGMFKPADRNWNLAKVTVDEQFYFPYVPYLEGSLKNWSRFYQIIAQANLILERVPPMQVSLFKNDEAVKNSYIGEALFMRAYTYFYITRVWGDPAYVTKTYNNVDYGNIPPVPRTAESKVLDSCILDLEKAATYLSYSGGDPEQSIRANKGSVYALMAHIYAWKHDYANAHAACQKVITEGGYSLEKMDDYSNIWQGQSSSESIFELPLKFNANGNESNFDFFGTFLKDEFIDNRYADAWVADKDRVETLYDDPADLRFSKILTPINASGGDEEGYLMLKYTNFKYEIESSKTNPYIDNNLVLFRLADIYLLDAEAKAMLNDASATNELDMIRNRAGLENYTGSTDQADLVTEILNERGRELIGEGQWFYDMIRTEPVAHALENTLYYLPERVQQKGYYWPIDMSVLFKTDPLLTQNPWWSAH